MPKKQISSTQEEVLGSMMRRLAIQFQTKREQLGMSVSEISKRSGVSPLSISSFEKGAATPALVTLFKLAEVVGLDLNISFGAPEVPAESCKEESEVCNYCQGNEAILYARGDGAMEAAYEFISSKGEVDVFQGRKRLLHGWVPFCPRCGRKFEAPRDENIQKLITNLKK